MDSPSANLSTIVVVDDEPAALEFCRYALIRAGYNVYAASSGEEALMYFRPNRSPVDLALVDVVMPGMSGVELVQRLEKLNPNTRIVLMSGYSPLEVQRILGKDTACYRSMWKPFEAATLTQMVNNVLNTPTEIRAHQKRSNCGGVTGGRKVEAG